MRFVDSGRRIAWVPYGDAENPEFEKKHPRDKEGKFSETEGGGAVEKPSWYTAPPMIHTAEITPAMLREKAHRVLECLDQLCDADGIENAGHRIAFEFTGWFFADFKKEKKLRVVVGSDFVNEFLKGLHPESDKVLPGYARRKPLSDGEKRAMLRKTVIAAGELPAIIRSGRTVRDWHLTESGHHDGVEVFQLHSVLFDSGTKKRMGVFLDMFRQVGKKDPAEPHYLNVEGSSTYGYKKKKLKVKDSADEILSGTVIEVSTLRVF